MKTTIKAILIIAIISFMEACTSNHTTVVNDSTKSKADTTIVVGVDTAKTCN